MESMQKDKYQNAEAIISPWQAYSFQYIWFVVERREFQGVIRSSFLGLLSALPFQDNLSDHT